VSWVLYEVGIAFVSRTEKAGKSQKVRMKKKEEGKQKGGKLKNN